VRAAVTLALALAAVVGAAGCQHAPSGKDVVDVRRADLVVSVEVIGELEAVDSTDIMPPSLPDVWDFKIASLADEGAEVKAGEPVVAFDASTLERELDTLRNEVDAAQKKLEKRRVDAAVAREDEVLRLAEAEAAVRKATLKAGAPAEQTAAIELKLLDADRRLAEMGLERTQHRAAQVKRADAAELDSLTQQHAYAAGRIAAIETNIARMSIVAPRAGTVVYPTNWRGEKKKVGDAVWRMQAVLQVVSLDKMIGKGQVDEVDLARVADGQAVSLRLDALPDVQLHGKVASIAKNVEPRSQTDPSKVAQVKLTLTDTGSHPLRPGMRFRGEIETARLTDVVVIPAEAVFVTADGPVAYRVRDDDVEAVPVKLGHRNATTIEVTSGLAAGDRVSRIDPTRSGR
jgi:HlyD family secretion protein